MKARLFAVILVFASRAFGLTGAETRAATTDIVIADIINAAGTDSGAEVRATASIQVIQVFKGDSRPGASLSLEWRYSPGFSERPDAVAKFPKTRAIFFLRSSAPGIFEPLRISSSPNFGGVFVEMPRTSSPRAAGLSQDAPVEEKLAREVQWALEELIREHGSEIPAPSPALAAAVATLPAKSPLPTPILVFIQLQGLFTIMDDLKIENSVDAFRELSTESDPNLKLFGFEGRIKSGDLNAFLEIEKLLPTLVPAFNRWRWSWNISPTSLKANLPATHAMGRIAISETPLPGLEGIFISRISQTQNFEFLPYLAVTLQSPEVSIRDITLMAFCQLIRTPLSRSNTATLWEPEMNTYCPHQSPMADREQEQKDVEYWSRWWESHSFKIGQTVELPRVTAPARYKQPLGYVTVALSPEKRFGSVLNIRRSQQSSGSRPIFDPVTAAINASIQAKQASAADLEAWNDVAEATTAKLAELDKRARDLLAVVRTQGREAGLGPAREFDQEKELILKGGLEDLRNRLSMNAWEAVQRAMNNIAGASVQLVTPRPPR